MSYGFKIIVEGDYAAFNRPEFKVERVSYDIPTPGALEGLLKSVYWKPAVKYVIDRIVVYNPINFTNIRRNEVKEKVSFSGVKSNMKGTAKKDVTIYTKECITQKASLLLKDVKYGIEFHFELTNLKNEHEDENEKKHYNIIKRRLENGQCFRTPCLGSCEFPVKKFYMVDEFNLNEIDNQILSMGEVDFGYMSYRLAFKDQGKPINNDWENPKFSDKASTIYYRPKMINGVIDVSKYAENLMR